MDSLSWADLLPELRVALVETFIMVGASLAFSVLFGLPLGFFLFLTKKGMLLENRFLNLTGGLLTNFVRSLPFVILLILLIPFSLIVTGKTTGPIAAIVPLAVASVAFYARLVESALSEVSSGVIEAARAFGSSNGLIVRKVLFPEAKAGLARGLTVTTISLIGFSAMAGVVGGGGIGFLAINYGYYRYETGVMVITVVLLIVLVQTIQSLGDAIAHHLDNSRSGGSSRS
jgi:D-methionine transport system permease protein